MAAHDGPLISGNTFTATTSAAEIIPAANHHRSVAIQNIDSINPLYIGGHTGAALTAANGWRLAAGESIAFDLHPLASIYAISGGTVEGRFLVVEGISSV